MTLKILFTRRQIYLNIRNFGKLKILVWVKGTFGGHLWLAIMLLAILHLSHNLKSQQ